MMIWERRSYHVVSCNRISPFWTRNVWLTDSSGDGEAFLRCNTLRSPSRLHETKVSCENRPSQKKIHLPTIGGHFRKNVGSSREPSLSKSPVSIAWIVEKGASVLPDDGFKCGLMMPLGVHTQYQGMPTEEI